MLTFQDDAVKRESRCEYKWISLVLIKYHRQSAGGLKDQSISSVRESYGHHGFRPMLLL